MNEVYSAKRLDNKYVFYEDYNEIYYLNVNNTRYVFYKSKWVGKQISIDGNPVTFIYLWKIKPENRTTFKRMYTRQVNVKQRMFKTQESFIFTDKVDYFIHSSDMLKNMLVVHLIKELSSYERKTTGV